MKARAYLRALLSRPFVRSMVEQVLSAYAVAFLGSLSAGVLVTPVPTLRAAALAGLAAAFMAVKGLVAQWFGSHCTATFDGGPSGVPQNTATAGPVGLSRGL